MDGSAQGIAEGMVRVRQFPMAESNLASRSLRLIGAPLGAPYERATGPLRPHPVLRAHSRSK